MGAEPHWSIWRGPSACDTGSRPWWGRCGQHPPSHHQGCQAPALQEGSAYGEWHGLLSLLFSDLPDLGDYLATVVGLLLSLMLLGMLL